MEQNENPYMGNIYGCKWIASIDVVTLSKVVTR